MKLIHCVIILLCLNASGAFSQEEVNEPQAVYKDLKKALVNPDLVVELNLRRSRLKAWPEELKQFPNLRVLDLSHNRIDSLPRDLHYMENLEELNLNGNKLDSLPASVGHMTALKSLKVGNNMIYHVSRSIGQLQELEYLELWSNNIYYLPLEAADLKKLRVVDMRGTRLSDAHQENIRALFSEEVKVKMSISCDCD